MAQALKSFIHVTPNTASPPPCRCCGKAFPTPDFRLYERRSEGPWPLKASNSKTLGKGSGGKGSQGLPIIRPIQRPDPAPGAGRKSWADMASSHATTPQGPSRASSREPRPREDPTATVSLLLGQAERCSDVSTQELLRDAACRLLRQNAGNVTEHFAPSVQSKTVKPKGKTVAIAKLQAIDNQLKAARSRENKLQVSYQRQASLALETHQTWTKT